MSDFGNMGERQMLVGAFPGDVPAPDDIGGNADMIGDQTGGKNQSRQAEVKQRP